MATTVGIATTLFIVLLWWTCIRGMPSQPQVIEVILFLTGINTRNSTHIGMSVVFEPPDIIVNQLVEKGFTLTEHYLVTANSHWCYCWVLESEKWYPLGWVDGYEKFINLLDKTG